MIGAILGDIIGSAYEFNPTNNYDFKVFAQGSKYTDDTICTIGVADAILNGRNYKDAVHDWCRRYKGPKGGFGGSFLRWVMADNPVPYNSFGNGSAMRVSPIGWLFDNEEDVLREAEKSAAISHDHPEGIKGAQAVALAILRARKGWNMPSIIKEVEMRFGYKINGCNLGQYVNRFDETCQGTIPPAFMILQRAANFEDAIRMAVALGADADTIGAIVGSIAEAYFGGVPVPWYIRMKEILPDDMLTVVQAFEEKTKTE